MDCLSLLSMDNRLYRWALLDKHTADVYKVSTVGRNYKIARDKFLKMVELEGMYFDKQYKPMGTRKL